MVDLVQSTVRSRIMSRIQGKDTKPEIELRRLVHALGYRYSLYRKDLPGTPDLVFTRRRKIIFVHGCFWHQHDCPRGTRPTSNLDFWNRKLDRNVERDRKNISDLTKAGWSVLIVWECEIKTREPLTSRIKEFLG